MTTFINEYGDTVPRSTIDVEENDKKVRVTYRGTRGSKFTVMLRQKPNAIGFGARLPGDRRK